jgi:transcriptional regulator with XRE-family HTH domain
MTRTPSFAQRLVQARARRGLTQVEVQQRSGIAPTALSHMEHGHREPSLANLRALAQALDVSADYLLGLQDQPSRPSSSGTFTDLLEYLSEEEYRIMRDCILMLARGNQRKERQA